MQVSERLLALAPYSLNAHERLSVFDSDLTEVVVHDLNGHGIGVLRGPRASSDDRLGGRLYILHGHQHPAGVTRPGAFPAEDAFASIPWRRVDADRTLAALRRLVDQDLDVYRLLLVEHQRSLHDKFLYDLVAELRACVKR